MKIFRRVLSLFMLGVMLIALASSAAYAESGLVLPKALKIIEERAFYGDKSLGTVVLPDGITEIHSRAFANSSVSEINLPLSLDYIADDAFDNAASVSFFAKTGSYGYNWAVQHNAPVYDLSALPESAHPYASNCNLEWVYRHPTSAASLYVTFSSDTELEADYDFLTITDANGNATEYSGTDLAGIRLRLPGNTFRLKLTSDGSVQKYGFRITDITASSKSEPMYRALLIGNNAYPDSPLYGCINDMNAMSKLLRSFSNGFTCTTKPNQTKSGILSAISSTFAGATENDVSLFYYAGHGSGSESYVDSTYSGALYCIDGKNLTSKELADALSKVPGRVIVILDSCFSGAMINRDAGGDLSDTETFNQGTEDELAAMEAFNQSMIDAFTAQDTTLPLSDDAVFDIGELATSKFVVITGASKMQTSGEISGQGLFTTAFVTGGGCTYGSSTYNGSMPADSNKDKRLSVAEIGSYSRSEVNKKSSTQTVQYYAANTSEVLFWR